MRAILALLFVTVCVPTSAQAVAVFNDFSPTVKGMTIGASHCYIWAHLGAPWDTEAACFTSGVVKQIEVGNGSMQGSFPLPDGGMITWLVNGAQFSMVAQPSGGVELQRAWTE